jgi:hypothetical protein
MLGCSAGPQLGYLGAAVAASFATTYFIILTGMLGCWKDVTGTRSQNSLIPGMRTTQCILLFCHWHSNHKCYLQTH